MKKKMTTPRLEITAVSIAVRPATPATDTLSSYVIEESQRQADTCSLMQDVSWKYCPTDENSSDLRTRGKHPL